MKNRYILSFLLIVLFIVSCDWGGPEDEIITPNLRVLQSHEKEMVSSSSQFAIDLFHQLRKKEEDVNQLFSPYSIHQALSMAMNGNEGEVLEEFISLLRHEDLGVEGANKASKELTQFLADLDPRVKISIANGMWYRQGLRVHPSFKETITSHYHAEVAELDMLSPQAPNIMNQWVESKTNGLIKDLIDYVPPDAIMYLINAVYFNGDWKSRFQASKTQKEPFYINPTQEVQVDMMQTGEASTYRYYTEGSIRYLEIPYSSGQYNMGILIPQDHDLEKSMDALTFENLENWRENAVEGNFILKMPKFKMRYKMGDMKKELTEMGLQKIFRPSLENFTLLFDHSTQPRFIGRVIHEAFIELDERGTEAAAATAVEIRTLSTASPPASPTVFVIDRPFVFFIQEKYSGAILFIGKLVNPQLLD